MVFHEFRAHACTERLRGCVSVYTGGGVENTGVVRSIRTSHGSIGACTQVQSRGESPQIVTVYKITPNFLPCNKTKKNILHFIKNKKNLVSSFVAV